MATSMALTAGAASGVLEIVSLSLAVSSSAVLVAALIGLPIGYVLGSARKRRVSRAAFTFVNAGMSLPPVVVGLVVYLALSRRGPLGSLNMLYSAPAMVLAQTIIAIPLVMGISAAAIGAVPLELRLQARSLGASAMLEAFTVAREARRGVVAAVVAGFGGVISEVGAVMIVGGNVEHSTRVMTTAIVLNTRQGRFIEAIALGLVLLGIALVINGVLTAVQHPGAQYER